MNRPVAVYLRVSTDDQDHASQRAAVLKWLDARGTDPAKVAWYVDTMSGAKTSRKDYDRLKRDVGAGRVKLVVVFSLDRLGRDMIEGMALVAEWARAGVGIASVTQAIDITTGGPIGLAIACLLFAFAQVGREQREQAQRAGIVLAKAAGVYKGRKPGAVKGGAEGGLPARAVALKAKGLTAREVGQALGVSEATVWRYLR